MPFTNLRNAYEFDPQDYDYQSAGGLPGLLRDAMRRQGLQQGSEIGPTANSAPSPYSDGYGNPQGLLGRLLELQAKQGMPSGVDGGTSSSRAAPMATPIQYRVPMPGLPPISLPGPTTAPQIPMPTIPEPWEAIGRTMQLLPRLFLGGAGGGGGYNKDCKEENRQAREICTEAFANNWNSDYGVGPYKKESGAPWSIDDCKRGLMSEECGGNRYERPPEKKIKRYRLR